MEERPDNRPPPAVWTPEDAANFLRTAITESQRPLADLIRRQGVPAWILLMIILIFVGVGAGVFFHLRHAGKFFQQQLENSESRTVVASADRARALEAESTTRSELAAAGTEVKMLREKIRQMEESIEKREQLNLNLRQRISALDNSQRALREYAEGRRAEQERAERRFRLQEARIRGQEAEKEALQKQLEAIRSLISDEESPLPITQAPPFDEPEQPAEALRRDEVGQKPVVDYVPTREDIEGADTANLKIANHAYWEAAQLLGTRSTNDDDEKKKNIRTRAVELYSRAIDAYEKAYVSERYNPALLSRLKMAKFQRKSLTDIQE